MGVRGWKKHPWTKAELETLCSMAGDMPWSKVVHHYRSWATAKGLPLRTERAMRKQLEMRGISLQCYGSWVTTTTVAEMIGTSSAAIRRWVANGWVESYAEGSKNYISRRSLRSLATERPILFSGGDRMLLFELLEDAELVDSIRQQYPKRVWNLPTRVRCIDTGKVYPSISRASRAVYVTSQALRQGLQRGHRIAGYRWEKVA